PKAHSETYIHEPVSATSPPATRTGTTSAATDNERGRGGSGAAGTLRTVLLPPPPGDGGGGSGRPKSAAVTIRSPVLPIVSSCPAASVTGSTVGAPSTRNGFVAATGVIVSP